MNQLSVIFLSTALAIIGALPFGLVNLSVMDVSHRVGRKAAIKTAAGALVV